MVMLMITVFLTIREGGNVDQDHHYKYAQFGWLEFFYFVGGAIDDDANVNDDVDDGRWVRGLL